MPIFRLPGDTIHMTDDLFPTAAARATPHRYFHCAMHGTVRECPFRYMDCTLDDGGSFDGLPGGINQVAAGDGDTTWLSDNEYE